MGRKKRFLKSRTALKTPTMRLLFFACLLLSMPALAQLKDYRIGLKGDTLNGVDKNGIKQGKWVVKHEELRGEPGYEEEGVYFNDRKEGPWRKYTPMGDLFAIENYHWGFKDGVSQYFGMNGDLLKEESWRAFNPDKVYDTIDVEDVTNPGNYKSVIIKNEGSSLKNGTWKYYDPTTGFVAKTEIWLLGKQEEGGLSTNSIAKKSAVDSAAAAKTKPKEVLEFEKKNAGKKKVKYRDGTVSY